MEDLIEDIPDLSGFECRWNSVKSNKGFTLALLIKARLRGDRETEIYESIISEIFRIFGSENDFNPFLKIWNLFFHTKN
ncbi:MAG: DUF3095 family protein [Ignavibacteriales bacterium]|nr:DUF3095 family protein [Ignavibacteriales bacterium]